MALTVEEQALITAGVIASSFLEIDDPTTLKAISDAVSVPALGLALLMVEMDASFASRWEAAGTDWMAQAAVLREALLFVLTPEQRRGDA